MTVKEKSVSFFTQEELAEVKRSPLPHHVAIIPDGTRRWAKQHLTDFVNGYEHGREALVDIGVAAKELGIKVLTIYTFSTENRKRPSAEVALYLDFVEQSLKRYEPRFLELSARFHAIGEVELLPPSLVQQVRHLEKVTEKCNELDLILAINYGSRNEIARAAKKMAQKCLDGTMNVDEITEETFLQFLDTSRWPDPDLLIRTSGERRMSNYLLWQASYTEIYVDEETWPNFGPKGLFKAVKEFQSRSRRMGR
ncbi:MAG TPA: polyprenyl diphosphate synthase [Chlamydiales bacterium]|nr:polyprenyl diphosphate synthase [Chlamydiales bacterium]